MPISWKKRESGVWVEDGTTHVGLVMGPPYTEEIQVMSDVWETATKVDVWNPEKEEPESVLLYVGGNPSSRIVSATVDISETLLEYWEIKKQRLAEEEARREEEREARAQEALAEKELKTLSKGCRAIVVRGRKVPRGTVGTVIWIGAGSHGDRVGIQEDDLDTPVHWTAASNVEVLIEGVPSGTTPPGGWVALRDSIREAERAWERTFPKRGDKVRIVANGVEGTVKWVKKERLGVLPKGAKKKDYLWCNAWEVAILRRDGTEFRPSEKRPLRGLLTPLAHLPHPYCLIHTVQETEKGWIARDSSGHPVVTLTEEGAKNLLAQMEALP